jgi:hypothetical protein
MPVLLQRDRYRVLMNVWGAFTFRKLQAFQPVSRAGSDDRRRDSVFSTEIVGPLMARSELRVAALALLSPSAGTVC